MGVWSGWTSCNRTKHASVAYLNSKDKCYFLPEFSTHFLFIAPAEGVVKVRFPVGRVL